MMESTPTCFFYWANQAFALWRNHGWGMEPGMMGWGYGRGWFGTILMAVFWIVLIAGIIFLLRWLWVLIGKKGRGTSEESPLETLKRRYAKGEINKEEFDQKKKDLEY